MWVLFKSDGRLQLVVTFFEETCTEHLLLKIATQSPFNFHLQINKCTFVTPHINLLLLHYESDTGKSGGFV